jgi:cation diffusion facilitator CzcD-associated flavoprotein CzcO
VPSADCIVIGAGPGGLGTAALLQEQGLDVVVLERAPHVAPRWRSAYDRLRANTSSWFSHLPGERFPRQYGRWPTRDQMVAYYTAYARERGLDVRTGVEAERVERVGDRWEVATSAGRFAADVVAVATGKHKTPVIPDWPGRATFAGELLHADDYRHAGPYRGLRALVVGAGNSGMDIALDLLEGGAREPVGVSFRRPPHIMPRAVLGLPQDVLGVASRRAPRRLVDLNAKAIRRVAIGDLADVGLPIPRDGTITRFEEDGRVPTVDAGGFTRAVRAGRIRVFGAVARLERNRVVFADGRALEADVVVAATGYRPDLEGLVGHLGLLDDAGLPRVHAGETDPRAPGLHFVGYLDPRSGQLRELRLQARAVARQYRRMVS